MSQPTFSYAQAAKGQVATPQPTTSPAPASVSSKDDTTTVSTSVTAPSVASSEEIREPTKQAQADSESGSQKQDSETPSRRESKTADDSIMASNGNGEVPAVDSVQSATEEKTQRPTGRSSRGTDSESRKGRKGKKGKKDDKDADSEVDKAQEQAEKEPPKPVILSEAPIPSVNPWHQRKAGSGKPVVGTAASASAASAPADDTKKNAAQEENETSTGVQNGTSAEKSHKKSTDVSRGAEQGPRRAGPRGSRGADKDEKNGSEPLPSVSDASLWPDVKTAAVAVDDGKKKVQDKAEPRGEKEAQGQDDSNSSKRQKKGWVAIPYVPTVNFQTPMPQRSSKPRGGARGGREAGSSRGSHNNATSPGAAAATSPTTEKTPSTGNTGAAKEGRPRESSNPAHANSLPPNTHKRASVDMSATRDARKPSAPATTDRPKDAAAESSASTAAKVDSSRTGRTEFNPAASEHQPQQASRNFSERRADVATLKEAVKEQNFTPRERGEGQGRGRGGFRGRGGHNGSVGGHAQQASYTNGQYPAHSLPGRPNNGPYSPPAHQNGFSNGYNGGSSRGGGRGNGRGGPGSAGYGRVNSNGAGQGSKAGPANAGNVNFDYPMQQYPAFPIPQQPVYDLTTVQFVMAQVEYYLSVDNLCKDFFIRKRMDSQGFVPFELIAGFRRLKDLAPDEEYIRLACETSDKIDYVVGDDHRERLRLREKWDRFVLDMAEREEDARTNGPAQWFFKSRHSRSPFVAPPVMPMGYHPATSPPVFNGTFSPEEQMYQQSYMNGGAGHYDPAVNGGDMNGHRYTPETQLSAAVPEFSPTISQGPQQPPQQQVPFTLEGATTFTDQDVEGLRLIIANGKKDSVQSPEATTANGTPATAATSSELPQANGTDDEVAGSDGAEGPPASPATKIVARAEGDAATGLAPGESKEKYVTYRQMALEERHHAKAGETPRLMQGLYDFWSHFLIYDFNSRMYDEFRNLALEDASKEVPARHGLRALVNYYNELFDSDQPKPWGDRPVPEVFNLHFRSALSLDPSMGTKGHARV